MTGLTGEDDDEVLRLEKYGVNVIPQKPPPSLLQLAWEAYQDPLLIILTFAAFLTIGLSFYKAPVDDAKGKIKIDPDGIGSDTLWAGGVNCRPILKNGSANNSKCRANFSLS